MMFTAMSDDGGGRDIRFVMIHAVTEYDRKQEAKKVGYNPYALPQYLGAVSRAADAIAAGENPRAAILSCFSGRLATAVLKSVGEPAITREEARRW
jgi:hypothetical protein